MNRISEQEWKILEVLWKGNGLQLGAILEAMPPEICWTRTTAHTYLTRMISKGLVRAQGTIPKRYLAAVSREDCVKEERQEMVDRLYRGSAGRLVMSFVKDGSLTREEREELRRLLDEMEV